MIGLSLAPHLLALGAIVALHAGRARMSLVPTFLGCGFLTYLMWQLMQTTWSLNLAGLRIDTAFWVPLPAMLAGLALLREIDGNPAALAYLATMTIVAGACQLLGLYMGPLPPFPADADASATMARMQNFFAITLIGAGGMEMLVGALASRLLPPLLSVAVALLTGMFSFVAFRVLLTDGAASIASVVAAQAPAILLSTAFPELVVLGYGALVTRGRLPGASRRPGAATREDIATAPTQTINSVHRTERVVGHDFFNLLFAIDSNLSRLRGALGATPEKDVAEPLQAMADAVILGRDLVRQLESSQPFSLPDLHACDLRALVDEAVALQRPTANGAGVRVKIDGASVLTVAADRTQIVRVLLNVIGNAIRACPRGGMIRLELSADAAGAVLRVRDDGIGMTEEQLDRAFDPGYSTKVDGRGGLGLAISYLIVDAHGGHLGINSTAGKGTTVTIRLPARKMVAATAVE